MRSYAKHHGQKISGVTTISGKITSDRNKGQPINAVKRLLRPEETNSVIINNPIIANRGGIKPHRSIKRPRSNSKIGIGNNRSAIAHDSSNNRTSRS